MTAAPAFGNRAQRVASLLAADEKQAVARVVKTFK
jgi:hypothetical protein